MTATPATSARADLYSRYLEAGGSQPIDAFRNLKAMEEAIGKINPYSAIQPNIFLVGIPDMPQLQDADDYLANLYIPAAKPQPTVEVDLLYIPGTPAQPAAAITEKRKGNINPQPVIDKATAFALTHFGVLISYSKAERLWTFNRNGAAFTKMTSQTIAPIFRNFDELARICRNA